MTRRAMAVVFERYGQLHYLDPGPHDYSVGDWVRYPTPDGDEVAQVVWAPEAAEVGAGELPLCPGPASRADLERDEANRTVRAEAQRTVRELVERHGLPMKVVGVDFIDRSAEYDRLVAVYYTAPHRVDFRQLLGELARALDARIDLRQIGARDAARITGGVGHCGRELCCTTFLTDFEPVSIRLARVQGLSTNPLQISGACGRLMCCLKYEHPLYVEYLRKAPSIGEHVETSDGESGVVVAHDVVTNTVKVRQPTGDVVRCPLESVCATSRRRRERVAGRVVDE